MNTAFDPGSFRDPEGRVFQHDGRIYRTLSAAAQSRMRALIDDGVLADFIARGLLLDCSLVAARDEGLDDAAVGATVMRHTRIATMTYPYEWSFDMLRHGALATLDLLSACLQRDLILKDATAYNLAVHDGAMTFFDTLSIDRYVDGSPWDGYAQFCREFLFPLMLTAYRGVEYQPWYRGAMAGIAVRQFARLMGWRDKLRPGVLKHVTLQARLERSFADADVEMRGEFTRVKFSKALIEANIAGLRKLIAGLGYAAGDSVWASYTATHSYSAEDAAAKRAFVVAAVERLAPRTLIDLGGNTGDYTLAVADRLEHAICVDIDPACINTLWRRLRADGVTNVVAMVSDLTNPSPAQGWALAERAGLHGRLRADAFLALALVHHLAIGGNVPIDRIVAMLAGTAPGGVVEWVDKSDAMVQRMLRNRTDVFADYDWEHFRAALESRFTIADMVETHAGARRLVMLMPAG